MHSAQFARVSLSPAGDWLWMTRVSVSSQSVTKSTLPKWPDFASLERESKFRAPKRREIKRHSQNRENYLILFGEPSSGYLLFFFFWSTRRLSFYGSSVAWLLAKIYPIYSFRLPFTNIIVPYLVANFLKFLNSPIHPCSLVYTEVRPPTQWLHTVTLDTSSGSKVHS